ncbi:MULTISPECIES: hypothetical protein [Shewanella]|uniref:Phage shock protein B n=1 Tax=Shewanella holmiensis TaxID=2952222 RepID=A0A9X2WPE6_9GAMM|nr:MULTISPECIES: hypothetical protein [Shewanella]MCT7942910.1 hypothetical protein [Shewanella holmiensis]MDP5145245.1 hypothetical protein [Shewanella sp. ULN5]
MNVATLALLIPILAIIGSFVISIMKLRAKQLSAANEYRNQSKSINDELQALRNRVEVLERLVTEDAYDLTHKINNA